MEIFEENTFLVVLRVFQTGGNQIFVGLDEGIRKTQYKSHGGGRGGIHHDNTFQKRKIRDILSAQEPRSFLFMEFP